MPQLCSNVTELVTIRYGSKVTMKDMTPIRSQ